MGVLNPAEIFAAGGAVATKTNLKFSALAAIGDSITEGGYDGTSFYNRLAWLEGGVSLVGNYADGGKRSDEILAEQVPLALTSGASHCTEQCGTNDISQAVAETTLRTNQVAIWTALRAGGVEPIAISLQPVTNTGNAAKAAGHNLWAKLYARRNNIQYVDIWPLLANSDGTGGYAAGFAFDTVHPNSRGAKVIAQAIKGVMTKPFALPPLLSEVNDRLFSSMPNTSSAVANSISFTDTNADGVPDNFNTTGSGGTYTIQAADSGGFGKWARCEMAGGTAVGLGITALTLAALGWSIGDRLAVGFRMRWVDASQALLVSAKFTGVTAAAGSDVNILFNEQAGTDTGDDIYVYKELVIGGGTSLGFQWLATGTGYFEVNRPIITNLTKLGLA